jgi:hypothetical protein
MAVALEGHVGGHVRMRGVFGKSVGLFGQHFVAFNALAAVAISPLYVTALDLSFWTRGRADWAIWIVIIMAFVGPLLANGAIAYGVVRDLDGRPAQMLETLHALARRFLPMMVVAISLTLLVLPDNLLTAISSWLIDRLVPLPSAVAPSIFLPPTAVVFCIFFVAMPVCVAEQAGIGKSLRRSRFLTKGYRWQILATLVLIRVTYIAANIAVDTAALSMRGHTGSPIADDVVEASAAWIVETLFIAFLSVVTAVFYYELRAAKDGIADALIADAFG